MDYLISIKAINKKKDDLSNSYNSTNGDITVIKNDLSPFLNSEISKHIKDLNTSLDNICSGYNNIVNWIATYTCEITQLENNLLNFKSDKADTPVDFKGTFENIFGAKTIPTLKEGGNKDANIITEESKHVNSEVIENALKNNKQEFDNAYYNYLSDSTYIAVTDLGNGKYLTHIVVADPSQIHKGYANGSYGNGLETIGSASQRIPNWIIGVNGSHFNESGTQDINRDKVQTNLIAINDGVVSENSASTAGGLEICFTSDGRLYTAPNGASVQDLLNDGVIQTFSSHETEILENGIVQTANPDAMARNYNRTVLGMKEPGEYYIFSGYSSATEAAQTLRNYGCTYGKSLDQGGSVGLATKDEEIVKSTDNGGERPISDYFYISD